MDIFGIKSGHNSRKYITDIDLDLYFTDPKLENSLVTAAIYLVIAQVVTHNKTDNIRIREYLYRKYTKYVQYKHNIEIYKEYILEKTLKYKNININQERNNKI